MAQVVERAGLPWAAARVIDGWREELEVNRRALLHAGLWGVPSFRLLDGEREIISTWGQDRLWLVAAAAARYGRRA